jgi:hypothetical protein
VADDVTAALRPAPDVDGLRDTDTWDGYYFRDEHGRALTLCYETGREPIYGKPFHGWSCDCDECKGYDERGEPRPGEAPRPQASAASGSLPKHGMTGGYEGGPGSWVPHYGTEPDVSYAPDAKHIDAVRQEVRDQLAADKAAAEAKDKAEGGLERRYHVERLNDTEGKHTDCRYFVLDPQHDPLAREALRRYAQVADERGYRTLAMDLRRWVDGIPVGA